MSSSRLSAVVFFQGVALSVFPVNRGEPVDTGVGFFQGLAGRVGMGTGVFLDQSGISTARSEPLPIVRGW